MATKFTPQDVSHIALLANIPVTEKEKKSLAEGFTKTISVVENLNKLNVSTVDSHHMTGLVNVFREDTVDETRMFTQEQALKNAPHTQDGYFIVDQLIDQDE